MQKYFVFIVLLFLSAITHAQSDEKVIADQINVNNVIGFIPSKANVTNGWAIGWLYLDANPADVDSVTINGVYTNLSPFQAIWAIQNIVLGPAYALIFGTGDISYHTPIPEYSINTPNSLNGFSISVLEIGKKYAVNGFQISGLFHQAETLNGVSLTTVRADYKRMNGLMIAAVNNDIKEGIGFQMSMINRAYCFKGIQIGLYNKAIEMNGLQIGLWNKMNSRGFPLFNMNFKDTVQ